MRALLVREAGRAISLGLAAGVPLAAFGAQKLRAQLYGVAPGSIHVYVAAGATL